MSVQLGFICDNPDILRVKLALGAGLQTNRFPEWAQLGVARHPKPLTPPTAACFPPLQASREVPERQRSPIARTKPEIWLTEAVSCLFLKLGGVGLMGDKPSCHLPPMPFPTRPDDSILPEPLAVSTQSWAAPATLSLLARGGIQPSPRIFCIQRKEMTKIVRQTDRARLGQFFCWLPP